MSEDVAKKLVARFTAQVEDACREGRGEQLLLDYYQAQAEQVADEVFLALTATVADPGEMDADAIRTFVLTYPEALGRRLLEGVATVCIDIGVPPEHQVAAEMITAETYRTRLNFHFEQTSAGGSA